MPDILIRGMEMPTNVLDCPLNSFGICDLAQDETHCDCSQDSRPEWCPLVPLPEGHGRLVDAREVLEKADKASWFDGDVSELGLLLGSEVTTVVPAEGGEADGKNDAPHT
jgi:hypothetical protein